MTVQSIKKQYQHKLKDAGDPSSTATLTHVPCGCPTLLTMDVDDVVKVYICAVRDSGGIIQVNRKIVISVALGTAQALKPSLFPENRGHLDSILRCLSFVKGKGEQGSTKYSRNFRYAESRFLKHTADCIHKDSILSSLIVNTDETALPMVSVSNWSLDKESSKEVGITGIDDKRQLMALVAFQ